MNECEFCKKQYSSVSTLNRHKKTSKSCKIFQESAGCINGQNNFLCDFCKKEYSVKSSYTRHLKTCKVKCSRTESEQIVSLQNQINDLKEIIRSKPANIINQKQINSNNVFNIHISPQDFINLQVFDINAIKTKLLRCISPNVVRGGINDAAQCVANSICDYAITTDLAREKIVTKNENNVLKEQHSSTITSSVIKNCSDDLIKICNIAMEQEVNREDFLNKYNIENRLNIKSVSENINKNRNDELNQLSVKSGKILSQKSLKKSVACLTGDSQSTENFDELYDYSESE